MSIQLQDVRKSFGEKVVLRGVSLEVKEGETVVVIGGSGSGKSVLLKTIVGLLRPDGGRVLVDGQDVASLRRQELYELRRRVGYVFQFAALFDSMTVAENVAMGLRRVPGMSAAEIEERVRESLHLVDLDGYGDRYPAELSGGQRKRAGLARAIATRPKYVLYDEPTTGLDPVTTALIDRLILRLRDELGVTSLVITHNLDSAYRVGDRIAMLHGGVIRFEGTPDELRRAADPVVRGFVEGRPELLQEVV
ncbi:MAG: ABC transporter ATP-binding protein [bacterium]|jgi:phospholipid/cholesterol/gamma-HCH transport system ATP-binding protein|nr:MAG: ABC transporter ATP-binding protein [bacterium]